MSRSSQDISRSMNVHSFDTRIICFKHRSIVQLGCVVVEGLGTIELVTLNEALNSLCRVKLVFPNPSFHREDPFTESSCSLFNFISTCGEG